MDPDCDAHAIAVSAIFVNALHEISSESPCNLHIRGVTYGGIWGQKATLVTVPDISYCGYMAGEKRCPCRQCHRWFSWDDMDWELAPAGSFEALCLKCGRARMPLPTQEPRFCPDCRRKVHDPGRCGPCERKKRFYDGTVKEETVSRELRAPDAGEVRQMPLVLEEGNSPPSTGTGGEEGRGQS